MAIEITPADLSVFRIGSNFDQFAASGNPWVTPETWDTHVGIAQDQLAASALRRDALDYVRPAAPTTPAPLPAQVITRVEDGAHERSNRMRVMWQDLEKFAADYKAAPDYLAPITAEDVKTFRRAVAKVTPVPSGDIGWDVDAAKVRENHARWMADEQAKLAKRRELVLAHKARLAFEETI